MDIQWCDPSGGGGQQRMNARVLLYTHSRRKSAVFLSFFILDPPLNMKDGWGSSSSSSVAGFIHWFEGGKGGDVLHLFLV